MAEQKISQAFQERKSYRTLAKEEPHVSYWKDKGSYDSALVLRYLTPLREAKQTFGAIPVSLQTAVLNDLHWYFTVDLRERAPTVIVTEPMAVVFHEHVREIMAYIDHDTIASLENAHISLEVRHALFSYKAPVCHSPVVIDAFDHDQRLVRLSYFVHGTPPVETFLIDEQSVKPAHCKYRSCQFYRRMLLRQRIVWLPADNSSTFQMSLDGQPVELDTGKQEFLPVRTTKRNFSVSLQAVEDAFPKGKGLRQALPRGLTGLKIHLVRWLAQSFLVRRIFRNTWVFIDRDIDADDNAEHLCRWIRQHHPEVKAWFLLNRSSSDWKRLAKEGFNLMEPRWLSKLLILNCDHVISSHPGYIHGGLSTKFYGDLMRWRFTFLQHGVTYNDLSHWLRDKCIDIFVTSSPAEYASIVSDNTPYFYTSKETILSGMPRHDRLLDLSKKSKDIKSIVVMPTWRASLSCGSTDSDISNSQYVQKWRSLLSSPLLHKLIDDNKKQLVFMPHANSLPFLEKFNIPKNVQVLTKADARIQDLFASSTLMITDYSSVAFEMAHMRRQVIYYQFDHDTFYSGDHNWRRGYFDYLTDGFGPVAISEEEVISFVDIFLDRNCTPLPEYLNRMERAIPRFPETSCQQIFHKIMTINHPFMENQD